MTNEEIAEKIIQSIGKYVNGLGQRHLGLPMMDEVAVMQMEVIVKQVLDNPESGIEMPEYY